MSIPDPSSGGHLRVSDLERDRTIDALAEAATDGRLTLDEYSERAGKALASVTRDDLAALTLDLAPVPAAGAVLPRVASWEPAVATDQIVAIFGSEHRRGRFAVPARLEVKAVFGEAKLELQDATLHSRVTVIDVKVICGSIDILVPQGVDVVMSGASIFGSRSCTTQRDTPPGAPVIEVRGKAVFGEITVRHPGWKEGIRDAVNGRLGR